MAPAEGKAPRAGETGAELGAEGGAEEGREECLNAVDAREGGITQKGRIPQRQEHTGLGGGRRQNTRNVSRSALLWVPIGPKT